MNLLHLDSSILGANSASRVLSAAAVERLMSENPRLTVVRRDLAAEPIPHLSGAYLAAQAVATGHDPALAADLSLGSNVLEEFLAADIVVIGVAFYNFSISSQLKAWIDRIAVAGRTFRYGEHGPESLIKGKRIILCIARGGFYGADSPAAPFEHAETYLKALFGFLGLQAEVIAAEGIAVSPESRRIALDGALASVAQLAA